MAANVDEWVGSAHLFLRSPSGVYSITKLYQWRRLRPLIYEALKLSLAESIESSSGVDILKIHISDPHLIIQLKFYEQEICRKFLQSYHRKELHQVLRSRFSLLWCFNVSYLFELELKAGAEQLDPIIHEEERCLEYISQQKPDHLRDEKLAELEESLKTFCLAHKTPPTVKSQELPSDSSLSTLNSSLPTSDPPEISEPPLKEEDTFIFQNQKFANRKITPEDHQKFAKLVSKKWKQVGRSLHLQTKCRALRDPFIDNLAIEYEREGLYEQAYQLLRRYIDSEGKKATIRNLVAALEENSLINLAEEILGLHQADLP